MRNKDGWTDEQRISSLEKHMARMAESHKKIYHSWYDRLHKPAIETRREKKAKRWANLFDSMTKADLMRLGRLVSAIKSGKHVMFFNNQQRNLLMLILKRKREFKKRS